MTEPEENLFSRLPPSVVAKTQIDLDFALRLLHRETRAAALRDPTLELSEEEQAECYRILDVMAQLSFVEAVEQLRDASVLRLG